MASVLLVFYQYLLDEDEEVRTNACFGLGVLCAVAQGHLLGQYEMILARLSQVLSRESNRRMIDNILSCLCRMIVVSSKHVPLNQVIRNDFFNTFPSIVVYLGHTGVIPTFTIERRFSGS